MKKPKKRNVRSEAAQREAIRRWLADDLITRNYTGNFEVTYYEILPYQESKILAIFDLRDCYRKRKPLTGITKKLRSAIQPRRKK